MENASYTHSRGVGVRVLCGARRSYAYTADLSEEALLATARSAAAAFPGKREQPAMIPDFAPHSYDRRYSRF